MSQQPVDRKLPLPALHAPGGQVDDSTRGGSHWGGSPLVPEGWQWPIGNEDRPLDFLACLDLAQVAQHLDLEWLPKTGQLLFFYDTYEQPWGFEGGDQKGWRVVFMPQGTAVEEAPSLGTSFARRAMLFRAVETYAESIPPQADKANTADTYALVEQTNAQTYGDLPHHQVGGHPDAVQNPEMWDECELASNGVNAGSSAGYSSNKGQRLLNAGGAADWRLLLQIDTDETVDGSEWMWGDTGMLYFWVKEQDAREGRFDNAWLVLQCC